MHKLTILLPLKDRHIYTERWLRFNLHDDFLYFIADGSFGDENEKIIKQWSRKNILYKKFNPDKNILTYIDKMKSSLDEIKTPYVINADNDDFLSRATLMKLISELESSEDLVAVQGRIAFFSEKNSRFVSFKRHKDHQHLCNITELDALRELVSNFNPFWYALTRTEVQQNIFSIFERIKLDNAYLAEIFQSAFLLTYGKVGCNSNISYARQSNPTTSNAQNDSSLSIEENPQLDFILDQNFLDKFNLLCDELSILLMVDRKEVFKLFRSLYLLAFQNSEKSYKFNELIDEIGLRIITKLKNYFENSLDENQLLLKIN